MNLLRSAHTTGSFHSQIISSFPSRAHFSDEDSGVFIILHIIIMKHVRTISLKYASARAYIFAVFWLMVYKTLATLCTVFSARSLYAIARPSVCRLSVVCLSVTLVRPTQAVEIFHNISTALGTLAIHRHPLKILRRSTQGNPSAGGVRHKEG